MKLRASAAQETRWREAARIAGVSLDQWAAQHLDLSALLALVASEHCEVCGEHLVDEDCSAPVIESKPV